IKCEQQQARSILWLTPFRFFTSTQEQLVSPAQPKPAPLVSRLANRWEWVALASCALLLTGMCIVWICQTSQWQRAEEETRIVKGRLTEKLELARQDRDTARDERDAAYQLLENFKIDIETLRKDLIALYEAYNRQPLP